MVGIINSSGYFILKHRAWNRVTFYLLPFGFTVSQSFRLMTRFPQPIALNILFMICLLCCGGMFAQENALRHFSIGSVLEFSEDLVNPLQLSVSMEPIRSARRKQRGYGSRGKWKRLTAINISVFVAAGFFCTWVRWEPSDRGGMFQEQQNRLGGTPRSLRVWF